MTTDEQLWFMVGGAGFVLFMEGVFSYICILLNKKIPEQLSRAGAGLLLLILAIICLFNLPFG